MTTILDKLRAWVYNVQRTTYRDYVVHVGNAVLTVRLNYSHTEYGMTILSGQYSGNRLHDIEIHHTGDAKTRDRHGNVTSRYTDDVMTARYTSFIIPYSISIPIEDILANLIPTRSIGNLNLRQLVLGNWLGRLKYQLAGTDFREIYLNVPVTVHGEGRDTQVTIDSVHIGSTGLQAISGGVSGIADIDYVNDRVILFFSPNRYINGHDILENITYMGMPMTRAISLDIIGTQGGPGNGARKRGHKGGIVGTPGHTSNPRDDGRLVCLIDNSLSPCP